MGEDSHSRWCGFESKHQILNGLFSHYIVVKIVMYDKTENKQKVAGDGPLFK